jgi:hypothetical protein
MRTCVNFTAAQVLAALRGEVVTVREAVKHPDAAIGYGVEDLENGSFAFLVAGDMGYGEDVPAPYPIGNTLWVRETIKLINGVWNYAADGGWPFPAKTPAEVERNNRYFINAYCEGKTVIRLTNMPRWACRLNVTVKSVRVEQVDGGWEWVVEMVKAQP